MLPAAVNLPFYWSEDDLQYLKGSIAYGMPHSLSSQLVVSCHSFGFFSCVLCVDMAVARKQRIADTYRDIVEPLIRVCL